MLEEWNGLNEVDERVEWANVDTCSLKLSDLAVAALIMEAELTPKPALVDKNNSGAHSDLNIGLMIRSAIALKDTFKEIARLAYGQKPSKSMVQQAALIGKEGERIMFAETGGINTHKGAIWSIGLLVAGASMNKFGTSSNKIAQTAAKVASYKDEDYTINESNGIRVKQRYGVVGAKGEAQEGFPHVINVALPALRDARSKGIAEDMARLDALVALIAIVDDTCILHRGGIEALKDAKKYATDVLNAGGTSTQNGWIALKYLDEKLMSLNASPGGSADLLAATIFLDSLEGYTNSHYKI